MRRENAHYFNHLNSKISDSQYYGGGVGENTDFHKKQKNIRPFYISKDLIGQIQKIDGLEVDTEPIRNRKQNEITSDVHMSSYREESKRFVPDT